MLIALKSIWISLFHSGTFRADFDRVVQALSVFHCEAVKPANKRETPEAFNNKDWWDESSAAPSSHLPQH